MRSALWYIWLGMVAVLVLPIVGCNNAPKKLETAARLANERPDSAYTIISDIDYNDLTEDSLRAKYILTKALINNYIGHSYITDTLINDAVKYYISVGDTANWVLASQLLSGYDFIKGDIASAKHRLEAMIPQIKNQQTLWNTYIHILELAINDRDYTGSCEYADWLLKNTDVPNEVAKIGVAKGRALYMLGDYNAATAVYDSIINIGIIEKTRPDIARSFYCNYADALDRAGFSSRAIALSDSVYQKYKHTDNADKTRLNLTRAMLYANSGHTDKAMELLDSINIDHTRSDFATYTSIAMLKAALRYKKSGKFPTKLMYEVSKNMHRSYLFSQLDRQTAMESVIKLNEDNYKLKLQRQRLWLLVMSISFILLAGVSIAYLLMNRRKHMLIEAEERVETLKKMLNDTRNVRTDSSDSDKLKATLLRQLGIFKSFAGTPTQQSRDALRRISSVGNDGKSIESLVNWPEFYAMINNLYDGFHTKLVNRYSGIFNDKEQQIIVLLKAGFSTKEIGVLTEQTSATIYTRKSVIRKKLGNPENGDFIATIEEQIKEV